MSKRTPEVVDLFRRLRTEDPEAFLSSEPDLTAVNDRGRSLLQEAIASRKLDLAAELVKRKIDLNIQDESGSTALHYAAAHDAQALAEQIIAAGADPNLHDRYGNGALWAFAFAAKDDYTVVRLLIEHGADPAHVNRAGKSVLDLARQFKSAELWRLCGGNPDDF